MSIELNPLAQLVTSWAVGDEDARRLSPAHVFNSASESLFKQLLEPKDAGYAVIDFGSGKD